MAAKINAKANAHTAFRRSVKWKQFRLAVLAERGSVCETCGIKKKGLQLHHHKPWAYESLIAADFSLHCNDCHRTIEKLAKRLNGKKADEIAHLNEWLALFGPYLPTKKDEVPSCTDVQGHVVIDTHAGEIRDSLRNIAHGMI